MNNITIEVENSNEQDNRTSRKAIERALVANVGIAFLKLVGWFFSRSTAMLAESIHSGADSFNSVCLLVGLKRGSKPADKLHPYGYGLEANVWALFACLLMFLGAIFSIANGLEKIFVVEKQTEILNLLDHYHIVATILFLSTCFELWAVNSASNAVVEEVLGEKFPPFMSIVKSFGLISKVKSPTTKFVWYEDIAAFTGVIIAFWSLTVAKFHVPPNLAYLPDAIASSIIGLILLMLAIYLIRYNMKSLTVSAAAPQIEKEIQDVANKVEGVSHVQQLRTIDMGASGLIVNMTIEVDPETQVKDADDIVEKVEKHVREKIKNIAHVSIEMQANDPEEDWEKRFGKLIEEGKKTEILTHDEARMFSNFFDFTNTVVYEIMKPRSEVTFIDIDDNVNELIDIIIESGHTRIPVYRDNIDNIIGVINAKDVLKAVKKDGNDDLNIETLLRDITIVPENKPISQMLKDFTTSKNQLAAVVDEHGGVAGIITVEDILEEIVGEIYDEFDEVEEPEIIELDAFTANVSAKYDILDLNEKYDLDFSTEDFQTIGGYIFGELGREPELDDEIEKDGIKLKVLGVENRRITRVLLTKLDGLKKEEIEEETEV